MKNDNSRDTILNCALDLFSAKGYDAISVSDIVGMAGITKPTLYYFFGSKEGLFRELLKTNYDTLNNTLSAACRYEPHEDSYFEDIYPVLLRIASTYFTYAASNPKFYLMALSMAFAPPTSDTAVIADEFHQQQYIMLMKLFDEMATAHPNLRARERVSLWRFLAMINAQIGFWYKGHAKLESEDAQSIVRLFMHGMFS